jgi:phosphocarrier protein
MLECTMIERTVVVRNRAGLHTRPAAMIVKLAAQFKSDIYLESEDHMRINAKSIIGVMTLAAAQGTTLRLLVSGPDEENAAQAIAELFESGFGEPI